MYALDQQPDQLPQLHRRASEWYEVNGSRSDAIRHALRSEDYGWAAELIERAGLMTEDGYRAATWLTWTRALPDEMIRPRPVLSAWYACALLGVGELEAAEGRLKDAERGLEPGRGGPTVLAQDVQLRSLLATIAVVRAYSAQAVGDLPGTLKQAQRVFELLPEGDHLRREQATGLVGTAHWASGDLQAADRAFADYSTRMLAIGNIPDAMGTASVLADIGPPLGRLRAPVDLFTHLVQVGRDRGVPLPPEAADLYRALGELGVWPSWSQEIASRLYVSLYTVKAHARSIFDKLDAHSRTQAAPGREHEGSCLSSERARRSVLSFLSWRLDTRQWARKTGSPARPTRSRASVGTVPLDTLGMCSNPRGERRWPSSRARPRAPRSHRRPPRPVSR